MSTAQLYALEQYRWITLLDIPAPGLKYDAVRELVGVSFFHGKPEQSSQGRHGAAQAF